MRYVGGKYRIGKRIAMYLESIRPEGADYYEPFMGMASVIKNMKDPRYGSDIDGGVINMWKWGIKGWKPPATVTKEQYQAAKGLPEDHPLKAFIGYQCSFGARWMATYAEDKGGGRRGSFADTGSRSLQTESPKLKGAHLFQAPYWEVNPTGAIIYLDPPYAGHARVYQYSDINYRHFFLWAGQLAKTNVVIVSGYSYAPYPRWFVPVLHIESRIGVKGVDIVDVTETLFRVEVPTSQQVKELMKW